MTNKIGQTIRNARTHKGLSQAELAAKAGVSQAAIGHWERGTFTPRGKNLKALSEILGIAWQPDLPLPEFDETVEEPAAIDKRPQRESAFHGNGRLISSEHQVHAEKFDGWLASYLDGFDANTRIKSPASEPDHDAWEVDFISDRTIVEVRHPTSYHRIGETIERAMWRLSLFRAFYGDEMMCAAIIRRPQGPASLASASPTHERLMARLCAEADLMGIHLFLVDTPEEAARAILELEGREPKPLNELI
jgi:transcriptional regulator with XRE-family HTH domain